jgi:hypothetical protein
VKKTKLTVKSETLRTLASTELTEARGGFEEGGSQTGCAACPPTAYPPCGSVAGACSGIPYTCTLWTVECTSPTRCQNYPF